MTGQKCQRMELIHLLGPTIVHHWSKRTYSFSEDGMDRRDWMISMFSTLISWSGHKSLSKEKVLHPEQVWVSAMLTINSFYLEVQVLMLTASMTCLYLMLKLQDGIKWIVSPILRVSLKPEQVIPRPLWTVGSSSLVEVMDKIIWKMYIFWTLILVQNSISKQVVRTSCWRIWENSLTKKSSLTLLSLWKEEDSKLIN